MREGKMSRIKELEVTLFENEFSEREYQLFCKSLAKYNNYDKKPVVAELVKNSRWTTLENNDSETKRLMKNVAGVYCIGLITFESEEYEFCDSQLDWMYVGQTVNLYSRWSGHTQIRNVCKLIENPKLEKMIFLYYPFGIVEKEFLLKAECYCIGLFNPILNFGKKKNKNFYTNDIKFFKSYPFITKDSIEHFEVNFCRESKQN